MPLKKAKSLPVPALRRQTDAASLGFKVTSELTCFKGLMGQERAVRSMTFGLDVQSKGYNIFVVGNPGSGRTSYTLEEVRSRAKKMPSPPDWIYAYNFEEPGEPLAVQLPPGQAKELAKKMDTLVEDLKVALSKAFDNSQYEDDKAALVKKFQEIVNDLMEKLKEQAGEHRFSIKRTPQGFVNLPLIDDKDDKGNPVTREMLPEEFEKLPSKQQKELQNTSEEISQKTLEVLRAIREREKELKDQIKALESEICRNVIQPILEDLRDGFEKNGKLSAWFESLSEDIIENFGAFLASARDENAEVDFSRYAINVFVSNDPKQGAPVIRETNPTYYNLVGKVEYESRQGYLYTDFRRIMAGAMHRANGGFLILDAEDLFRQFMSWEALKRVMRTRELSIENLGEQLGYVPVSSLRPQAIPVDLKVVVVGTPLIYYLLNMYEPEFGKIFKIKADFDVDMPRTPESERKMADFICTFVQKENTMHFTAAAVAEVIEWTAREAEHQDRMTVQASKINELLAESAAWAQAGRAKRVDAKHVQRALEEKVYRHNMIEERLQRIYEEGTIRIDTEGSVVGQINGLTVLGLVDHTFGHPVRITANVFMGQEGVVNIEREVKLTGPIHNKGLLTLSSYLGRIYAQDMPISISARLAFEQTYDGIEGDSASSTELYCLLSALSGVPIKQGVGVTGSVDQFGNVQPIGGVNAKIEGFFRYCAANGLTGDQGVMIPATNVKHLMLHPDVVDAVKKKKFNIWCVSTIDEGIEILTGTAAKTIHSKVKTCLKGWVERQAALKKQLAGKPGKSGKKRAHDEDED